MESIEKRHAERELHRKKGPGPITIEKDNAEKAAMSPSDPNEEDVTEAVRNTRAGSSKLPEGYVQTVKGDDTIKGPDGAWGNGGKGHVPASPTVVVAKK